MPLQQIATVASPVTVSRYIGTLVSESLSKGLEIIVRAGLKPAPTRKTVQYYNEVNNISNRFFDPALLDEIPSI
ncbi:MAG: hypothetical protein Q8P44_06895 [Dehalococcoidia bacterium]|nr:hypothetical protein [Dehalococcoidia bacterium]